ncbi:hypothetical protein FQR65_LT14096 [Abscondita terminalis]|nr:hypothetical protein FQR65_LT14096 [Abscondita terminalis]
MSCNKFCPVSKQSFKKGYPLILQETSKTGRECLTVACLKYVELTLQDQFTLKTLERDMSLFSPVATFVLCVLSNVLIEYWLLLTSTTAFYQYNVFRALDWNEITQQTSAQRIEWIFNPPSACSWGGNTRVNYEEMSSLLCRVMAVMNSRPLTYVSKDGQDLAPLTPAHFIQGTPTSEMPDVDLIENVLLQKEYRKLQKLKKTLNSRFREENLSLLVIKGKQRKCKKLQIGNICLIGREDKKRLQWPMGKVLKLFPGRDGVSRVARLKIQGGELLCPIQRLYPLEANPEEFQVENMILMVLLKRNLLADLVVKSRNLLGLILVISSFLFPFIYKRNEEVGEMCNLDIVDACQVFQSVLNKS